VTSANFTIDDAIQAARKLLNDDAQRRHTDADIMAVIVPRVLQQLYSDRPDAFVGSFGSVNFKPSQADPLPFDDVCFNAFIEGIVAAIDSGEEESIGQGIAGSADNRAQRSRRA
jgi:hypothetical protein